MASGGGGDGGAVLAKAEDEGVPLFGDNMHTLLQGECILEQR